MKRMKKIVALFVAAVMCLTLSVSVFATSLDVTQGVYTLGIGIFDESGKLITEAKPGDKVYIGEVIYVTNGGADLAIEANKNAALEYAIMIDGRLASEYAYADEESMTDVQGCTATITDAEDFKVIFVSASIANTACTFGADKAVAKVGITLPEEETTYEFSVFEDYGYTFTADAETNANFAIAAPTTLTVAAKQEETTPSISTAEPTATEAGIAVERADGTKFTYDNCYTVTVSMTNANDATKAGMQFIPKKVYENADNTWTGYAEVEFAADGLGAGERAYTAALINIPRKLAGQNIDMMARGFMVVDGKTLTGTVVESVVNYKVTPEPGQN